jgi:hypothetical protein
LEAQQTLLHKRDGDVDPGGALIIENLLEAGERNCNDGEKRRKRSDMRFGEEGGSRLFTALGWKRYGKYIQRAMSRLGNELLTVTGAGATLGLLTPRSGNGFLHVARNASGLQGSKSMYSKF